MTPAANPDFHSLRDRLALSASGQAPDVPPEHEVELRPEVESGHSPNVFRLHPMVDRILRAAQTHPQAESEEQETEVAKSESRPDLAMVAPYVEAVTAPDEEVLVEPGIQETTERSAARVPKVIVVDRSGTLSVELNRAARGLVPEPEILKLDRPTQVVEIAEAEDPDVIVFSPEEVTAAGLRRLAEIHRASPRIVILLSDSGKTWSAAQMAASGASDFLPANATKARLRSKLEAALRTADQLRVEPIVVTERVVIRETVAEAAVKPAPVNVALGKVFVVASASGGSGKTLIATNLAAYLAKATAARVLLIDLDLQFGEVAPALHLHPARGIDELAGDPDELQATLVEHACGFKVLCAPLDPLAGERVGPDEIAATFEVARRDFDYIVVDTPPTLNEACLAAFDQAETLIITANMDVPSLKNMRRYLETIETLSVSVSRTVLVVNREDTGIGLEIKGVAQLFPQGFLAVLPVAREVALATNMGMPIMHSNPKSEVSRRLAEGFLELVPPVAGVSLPWSSAAPTPRRSSLLSRKKGKD